MKQVNVVIRTNNKKSQGRAKNKSSARSHMDYLHRHTDVLDLCSSGLNKTQFIQLLNGRVPYRLIVSPAKPCDMKALVAKTVDTIRKYNCLKKLEYIAYIHHDTDHVHAHILILPPKKKDFVATGRFIQEAVFPEVNAYLEQEFGKQTIEQQRQAYIDSANNVGQAKVDYDIRRLCNLDKQVVLDAHGKRKWVYNYIYNPAKERTIDSWKLDYVHNRINQLVNEGIADYDPKANRITFSGNFIMRKIVRGKIQEHLSSLPSSVDPNTVILRATPEKEIAEVLSLIERPEKHTMSRIVRTTRGTIELNEKKYRKTAKTVSSSGDTSVKVAQVSSTEQRQVPQRQA